MERLTVQEVAEDMGISQTCLREGLARGRFPFGTGFKSKDENKKRIFYISKDLYEKYKTGELGH